MRFNLSRSSTRAAHHTSPFSIASRSGIVTTIICSVTGCPPLSLPLAVFLASSISTRDSGSHTALPDAAAGRCSLPRTWPRPYAKIKIRSERCVLGSTVAEGTPAPCRARRGPRAWRTGAPTLATATRAPPVRAAPHARRLSKQHRHILAQRQHRAPGLRECIHVENRESHTGVTECGRDNETA